MSRLAEYFCVLGSQVLRIEQESENENETGQAEEDAEGPPMVHERSHSDGNFELTPPPRAKRLSGNFAAQKGNVSDLLHESNLQSTSFNPTILDRYPFTDHTDSRLPLAVSLFCFPNGLYVEQEYSYPTFFTFVLTDENGKRMYGSVLKFFEQLTPARKSLKSALYCPIALCVLSYYPFYSTFKEFLSQLYRVSVSSSRLPLERYICNFLMEVPLPPQGKIKVQYSIAEKTFSIQRSPPNELTKVHFDVRLLFESLSINNVIALFTALLLEHKIIMHSRHISLLGFTSEAILSFMYPFSWEYVYVPVLPRSLLEFLSSPTPFIMGVPTAYMAYVDVPSEVTFVDLDFNFVRTPEPLPPLPEHQLCKLLALLKPLSTLRPETMHVTSPRLEYVDSAFDMAPPPSASDTTKKAAANLPTSAAISEAFFSFWVAVLKDYRSFLKPPDYKQFSEEFQEADVFDRAGFISTFPKKSQPFFEKFFSGAAWARFLFLRTATAGHTFDFLLLDESIEAKENRSRLRLSKKQTLFLDDRRYACQKTFVAPQPNATNLTQDEYHYTRMPKLQAANFSKPRYVEPLVESDDQPQMVHQTQQAASFSRHSGTFRLRSNSGSVLRKGLANIVHANWILAYTAVVGASGEEHQQEALAVAFQFLETMKSHGAYPDEVVYRFLISACAMFGLSKEAMKLFEDMSAAHIMPDAKMFHHLSQAVAKSQLALHVSPPVSPVTKDDILPEGDTVAETTSSEKSSEAPATELSDDRSVVTEDTPVRRSTIRLVFADTCPACGAVMGDRDAQAGWSLDSNDYTVECAVPECTRRFVARFSVHSEDRVLVDSCEALSPFVLKKEIIRLLQHVHHAQSVPTDQSPALVINAQSLQQYHPSIFWNCVWHFAELKLSLGFLLDANFGEVDVILPSVKTRSSAPHRASLFASMVSFVSGKSQLDSPGDPAKPAPAGKAQADAAASLSKPATPAGKSQADAAPSLSKPATPAGKSQPDRFAWGGSGSRPSSVGHQRRDSGEPSPSSVGHQRGDSGGLLVPNSVGHPKRDGGGPKADGASAPGVGGAAATTLRGSAAAHAQEGDANSATPTKPNAKPATQKPSDSVSNAHGKGGGGQLDARRASQGSQGSAAASVSRAGAVDVEAGAESEIVVHEGSVSADSESQPSVADAEPDTESEILVVHEVSVDAEGES